MKRIIAICILFFSAVALHGEKQYTPWEYDLSGTWKIMRGNNLRFARPDFNDTEWPEIKLPSKHLMPSDTAHLFSRKTAAETDPHKGYVWYRKTFEITKLPPEDCALQILEIMNADRIYLNGARIGSSGRFPPGFRSAWSKFRSYPVPNLLLKKGKNTIAMQVYFNAEAWIMGPIELTDGRSGKKNKLIMDILLNHTMQGFSFLLFPVSIFFFLLFVRRNKETGYLFFSLCSLMLSILISLQYIETLFPDIPVSSNNIFKITQTGMVWFPPLFALFFRSYVYETFSSARTILYCLPSLVMWILMITATERYEILAWRNYFLLLIPLYSLDILYVSISQLLKKNRRGFLVFGGMLPIILLGFHDVLAFSLNIIESGVALFVYGIPLLLLIVAMHLVNRFVTTLNDAEKLNTSLQQALEGEKRLLNLEEEMSIARGLQMASVPKNVPQLKHFSTAVKFEPMEKIGGDFYNFAEIDENRMGLLLADVSGHGIPAAVIAAMVQVSFNVLQPYRERPVDLLVEMNSILNKLIKDNFLTASYTLIDTMSLTITHARAGHEPLLIYRRAQNRIDSLLPRGRAIGITEELPAEKAVTSISRGDRIILYTDCIPESFNEKKEMFGMKNFEKLIIRGKNLSPDEFCNDVHAHLEEWIGGDRQFSDDFTLVVVDIQ